MHFLNLSLIICGTRKFDFLFMHLICGFWLHSYPKDDGETCQGHNALWEEKRHHRVCRPRVSNLRSYDQDWSVFGPWLWAISGQVPPLVYISGWLIGQVSGLLVSAEWHTVCLLVGWLANWLVHWLIVGLVSWLID